MLHARTPADQSKAIRSSLAFFFLAVEVRSQWPEGSVLVWVLAGPDTLVHV